MLHDIAGDEGARSAQARLAVDRQSAVTGLGHVQEALDDLVAGRAAVDEEEVDVLEGGVREALGVVDLFVEADDALDVVFAEVGEVGLGRVQRVAVLDLGFGVGSAEAEELVGHDPVQVAVFHLQFNHYYNYTVTKKVSKMLLLTS